MSLETSLLILVQSSNSGTPSVSTMVPPVQRVGPLLAPLKVPTLRIRMADHDQLPVPGRRPSASALGCTLPARLAGFFDTLARGSPPCDLQHPPKDVPEPGFRRAPSLIMQRFPGVLLQNPRDLQHSSRSRSHFFPSEPPTTAFGDAPPAEKRGESVDLQHHGAYSQHSWVYSQHPSRSVLQISEYLQRFIPALQHQHR